MLTAAPYAVMGQSPPTAVSVYGTHQGGNVVYHYAVRKTAAIERFYIGCDCRSLERPAVPELQTLPVNARAKRTDDFGTWYELPAEAVTHPPGWRVRLLQPSGASGYWLEWYRPGAASTGASAGATVNGFSVTLPQPDETYLLARYALHRRGDGAAGTSGRLLLADTTPPRLMLTTRAVGASEGATAKITVNATASDDRDAEPRVVAESIERVEDGAPALRVLYSATDASGNRATVTARVPLPAERMERHDRTVTASHGFDRTPSSSTPLSPCPLPRGDRGCWFAGAVRRIGPTGACAYLAAAGVLALDYAAPRAAWPRQGRARGSR